MRIMMMTMAVGKANLSRFLAATAAASAAAVDGSCVHSVSGASLLRSPATGSVTTYLLL